MIIHILRTRTTREQMVEMQQMLQTYIKLAVDADTAKRWSDRVLELSGLLEEA